MGYSKKEQILNYFKYDSDEYINIKEKFDESEEYTNLFYDYLEIRKDLLFDISILESKEETKMYVRTESHENYLKKEINDIKINMIHNQNLLQEKIKELSNLDDNVLIKLLVIENFDYSYRYIDYDVLHYSSPFMSKDDFMQKMILPELTNEIKSFLRIEQSFSKYYNKIAYGNKEYEKLAKIDLSNDLVYKIIETFKNLNNVNDIKNHKDIIELEKYILDYKLNDGQDSKYIFDYFRN